MTRLCSPADQPQRTSARAIVRRLVRVDRRAIPELDVDLVGTTVDAVVRLVISHLVMPAAGGTDEVADQLARLMARGLGIPVD